jgi:threonylcarbamoyladenosine tRNA methylthiotransferase MtaB
MLNYISIGCKVNQAEIAEIRDKFYCRETSPHSSQKILAKLDDIKIGIINTCAVTGVSEAKSRKLIRRFIRENPDSRLIVTGCFAESKPDVVRRLIREDDIVVSNRDKSRIPELVKQLMTKSNNLDKQKIVYRSRADKSDDHNNYRMIDRQSSNLTGQQNVDEVVQHNRTRAFLKIQDGCQQFCSYCIVPFLRSEMWSKAEKVVEEEVKVLVANGHKEIVLSGVNLGLYGNLVGLLEKLVRVAELERIRISSIELNDVSDELINLMAKNHTICPHFHIPLQSGSDKILKLMRRNYSATDYINRISFIKNRIKNPSITTDVIVGFPGESDDDFEQTLLVCQKVGFSKIHIFCFSSRKDTLASDMGNKVKPEIIKKRFIVLNNLERELSLRYKQLFLEKEVDVLVEDCLEGFTERYVRVKIENNKEDILAPMRNQIVRVKINGIKDKWMTAIPIILSCSNK